MKKLISIFTILALVLTTMPADAMPHKAKDVRQTQAAEEGHDCHGHGAAKASGEETTKNDASDKCCDKGVCKCVGGTCHNGLSKVLGNAGSSQLALTSSKAQIASADENADSAFLEGLKRPPRT